MSAGPAGAADENPRERRSSPRRSLVVLLAVSSFVVGCGGTTSAAPGRLFDGSRTSAPPTQLAGLRGPAVLTRVRTLDIGAVRSRSLAASCLAYDWGTAPFGVAVERTGTTGESVTFLNRSGRQVLGCDNGGGRRADERRWCGVAAGQLRAGRLRDPRLDLGCTTKSGDPLGFVWVRPHRNTRYVAVRQRGYAEVYEVAGRLPIRIATSDVDADSLRASFAVSEYSRDGTLVREYGLTATPAG